MNIDQIRSLDGEALQLLRGDVQALTSADLDRPTPCAGWSVSDLLDHMTVEHLAIVGQPAAVDGTSAGTSQERFEAGCDRWLEYFATAPARVHIPSFGADVPVERVLAVHFADMIVHRWDLAAALGVPCDVDPRLLERADAVADFATAADSPLVGEAAAYRPALPADPNATPLQNLVRRYGRDHQWAATEPEQ